jgi:hypothetical protein
MSKTALQDHRWLSGGPKLYHTLRRRVKFGCHVHYCQAVPPVAANAQRSAAALDEVEQDEGADRRYHPARHRKAHHQLRVLMRWILGVPLRCCSRLHAPHRLLLRRAIVRRRGRRLWRRNWLRGRLFRRRL